MSLKHEIKLNKEQYDFALYLSRQITGFLILTADNVGSAVSF